MSDRILILNPGAGSIRSDPRILTRLKAHARLSDVEVVTPPGGPDALRTEARKAREEGRSHVLVAGGDGTVHAVLNGLLGDVDAESLPSPEELPVLGVLPAGTGNDLIRSLGFPHDLWKALGVLDWERTGAMDLIRVEGPGDAWCANVVTGGMAVREDVAPEEEAKADLGILSYLHQGVKALEGHLPLYELEITLDQGPSRSMKARTLVVANGRWAGAAIQVAPKAEVNDGLLDLLVVPEMDLGEMSLLIPSLLLGRHDGNKSLFVTRARRISIRSDPELDLSLDGELARGPRAVFSAVPGALRVLKGPAAEDAAFGGGRGS